MKLRKGITSSILKLSHPDSFRSRFSAPALVSTSLKPDSLPPSKYLIAEKIQNIFFLIQYILKALFWLLVKSLLVSVCTMKNISENDGIVTKPIIFVN